MDEFYKTLGLKPGASQEEVKIAYRKLSKKFHPDMNNGDDFFEDRFKEIQEAYEKLNEADYTQNNQSSTQKEKQTDKNKSQPDSKNKPENKYENKTDVTNSIEKGKTAAITSYILLIGVFIAMSMNSGEEKNSYASFHIRQALGLSLTFISLGLIISNFDSPMISISMWVFLSVLWTYGIFSAINGETKPVPLLGNYFQKWFSSIS